MVPGPRIGEWEGVLTPNAGPAALVPHPSQNSRWARPPERHCRPAHSHSGTQGHSVTTMLKLRGGRERKKEFPVFAAGDPGNTGWDLCPRWGPFGIKGEQQEGW